MSFSDFILWDMDKQLIMATIEKIYIYKKFQGHGINVSDERVFYDGNTIEFNWELLKLSLNKLEIGTLNIEENFNTWELEIRIYSLEKLMERWTSLTQKQKSTINKLIILINDQDFNLCYFDGSVSLSNCGLLHIQLNFIVGLCIEFLDWIEDISKTSIEILKEVSESGDSGSF